MERLELVHLSLLVKWRYILRTVRSSKSINLFLSSCALSSCDLVTSVSGHAHYRFSCFVGLRNSFNVASFLNFFNFKQIRHFEKDVRCQIALESGRFNLRRISLNDFQLKYRIFLPHLHSRFIKLMHVLHYQKFSK
ncbi:hypothetical protein Tco_0622833 [Tanacetum coccineum]